MGRSALVVAIFAAAAAAAAHGSRPIDASGSDAGRLTNVGLANSSASLDAGNDERPCPSCRGSERPDEIAKRRLEEIKAIILEKLKLTSVPNVTRNDIDSLPPMGELVGVTRPFGVVEAMYADQPFVPGVNSYLEKDEFYVQPEQAVVFPDLAVSDKFVDITAYVDGQNLLEFKISSTVLTRQLVSAIFRFHLSCAALEEIGDFTAVVDKVVRARTGFRTKKAGATAVTSESCGPDGRWIDVDVKDEILPWFTSLGEDNLGLKLRVFDSDAREINVRVAKNNKHRPFLKLAVADEPGRLRVRRMTSKDCDATTKETSCCRYPFTINFDDFGWDWIIEPRRFQANYCSGSCPYTINTHAHVIHQQRSIEETRYGPYQKFKPVSPCCVPRKFGSLSMLYIDNESNVLHGLLPQMVVESCGCA